MFWHILQEQALPLGSKLLFPKMFFIKHPWWTETVTPFRANDRFLFQLFSTLIISFSAKGKIGLLEAHFKILEFPKFRIPFLQCNPCMARSHLTLFYSPCEIGSQGNITRKFCILAIAIAINNKPSLLLAQQTHAFCQHQ